MTQDTNLKPIIASQSHLYVGVDYETAWRNIWTIIQGQYRWFRDQLNDLLDEELKANSERTVRIYAGWDGQHTEWLNMGDIVEPFYRWAGPTGSMEFKEIDGVQVWRMWKPAS